VGIAELKLVPIPASLLDRQWRFKQVKEQGEHEQPFAEAKNGWLVHDPLTDQEKRYLLVTTLPWSSKERLSPLLSYLWQPWGCVACPDVLRNRWALPTGCLNPTYMVVGEAPGSSTAGRPDFPMSRAWAHGKSARILRKATAMAGIYWETWFTNIIKCPVVDRKPTVHEEASCQQYLVTELRSMQPKVIILLGKRVQQSFPALAGTKFIKLDHPSYYARKGSLARAMAKDLIVALKEVGHESSAEEESGQGASEGDRPENAEWDGRSPLGT
jgi:uracil-DNA glycosylase family 4